MRVRKLDANGDYSFGHGETDFWINKAEGVAQNIQTRLGLWEGEWFLDKTQGTPWSQEVLGYGTASLRDIAVKTRIRETNGVSSNGLLAYSSSVNSARQFSWSAQVLTVYSKNPVTTGSATP